MRRPNGWVPVDTTLTKRADGTVTAKATAVDLTLSGGGSAVAMAKIGIGRSELSLGWPTALPTPVLSGDTATYPEVLPGVDLKIRADVDGFSQVLVVKTAEAAANPKLAELRLALGTSGVDARLDTEGNLRAVGSDGKTSVFHAAAPKMWDSSGSGASAASLLEAPATGSRVAAMATDLANDDQTLVVVPDQEMLTDPDTRFPVFIDPSVSVGRPAWAYVDKVFPGTAYFNRGDDDTGVGYEPEFGHTKRAFWRFTVAGRTVGADILKATFRASVTHAFGCTDASVQLWLTSQISTSTTWRNQPNWARHLDTVTVNKGRSACPGSGVEFDATSAYRSGASEGWHSVVLGLRGNETVSAGNFDWRRFASNPVLQVDYNHPPNLPTALKDERGGKCVTDVNNARRINATTPRLYAWIYDKDRAFVSGTKVKAQYEWYANGTFAGRDETSFLTIGSSGLEFKLTPNVRPFRNGELIGWRVRGIDQEGASGQTPGPISPWCFLRIDTTDPNAPTATSAEYPDDDAEHGSVGVPGNFTLTAGSTDTAKYRYSFNDNTCSKVATPAATGGKVTLQFRPTLQGTNQLYASGEDSAGNRSECLVVHNFRVAAPAGPVAHIRFDEGSGTSAADSADPARAATLTSSVSWTRGRVGTVTSAPRFVGTAAHFPGIASEDSGASTTSAAVDITKAFSVAAWVRLDGTGRNYTAVAQDGATHSGFYLGYAENTQRWSFRMPTADGDPTAWVKAESKAAPQTEVWTHLLASYDPLTKTATLYVNGVKQNSASGALGTWNAGGGLQIGRAKYNDGYTDEWPGDIDDVRLYNRVVSDQPTVADSETGTPDLESRELWTLVSRPYQLQGHYSMQTPEFLPLPGTEVPDVSDNAATGTLHGDPAAVWSSNNDGNFSPGAHFNGSSDYIDTQGPALRTDQPFTVAAWVRLGDINGETIPNLWSTALSQAGVRNSGFYLQYAQKTTDALNYWALAVRVTDTDGAVTPRVYSKETADIATWTHLAASYDPIDKKITLYVDGVEQGSTTLAQSQSWNAAGPVQIGRARVNGADALYWGGDVDDVHLYQGLINERGVALLQLDGVYPPMTG